MPVEQEDVREPKPDNPSPVKSAETEDQLEEMQRVNPDDHQSSK